MTVNAIILTGGRSRRFDGVHKPGVAVGGRSTISRILASIRGLDDGADIGADGSNVRGAGAGVGVGVWVAGPLDGLSETERDDVCEVREDPAFAGPLAGIAAAVAAIQQAASAMPPADATLIPPADGVAPPAGVTLILAGDMPMITTGHLGELIRTCRANGGPATGTDDRGKTQFLCAAWPTELLRARLADIGDPTDGAVKRLFAGFDPAVVDVDPNVVSDFDTAAELDEIRARLE
ncbi:molybdenum cofactor guanylyltransferase [Brevibacterium oceani]|uniref:molybdenum cofactor guanylyltransferase n=1 Tax=Brevibacterium oceani TaxID=358099 RepID=UPI0015E6779D|nr:NTP transferase domain-containing protein [Brevibacterium oceani]